MISLAIIAENNDAYDYIRFENGTNDAVVESEDDCRRLCEPRPCKVMAINPNRQFRGFTFYASHECYCHFEDDTSAFTTKDAAGKGVSESPNQITQARS